MSVQPPESPVRGLVPMREYRRVVEENERLREKLAYHEGKSKPVLLAHEVDGKSRRQSHRAPREGTNAARVLAWMKSQPAPVTTRQIRLAIDARTIGVLTVALIDLQNRGFIKRVDDGVGPGTKALWGLTQSASQPKE